MPTISMRQRPAAQREVEVEVYGTGGERRLHLVGRLRREAAEQQLPA